MKILYRYIDTDGNTLEEHFGIPGNWSLIPAGAVAVQVDERPENESKGSGVPE